MIKDPNHITVFEHESVRFDKGEKKITELQFKALEKYFGDGTPFFSLRYNGIQFNEHVGVIQVGKTVIEVLPKADKNDLDDTKWRKILIGMLKAVGAFDIKATSDSSLKIKPNTILDLYFEMFIQEVEYLIHNGLIKQYRKKEGNVTALKGSLQFSKQIQHNLIHQERFYVRYTTYDVEHTLHYILYKTICLLKQINTSSKLHSRIGALLLYFPEMPDIKISASTFEKIVYNRKNQSYKKSIEIAKLLLLQYHPDVSRGRNNVLALMFDMNKLWEQFVFVSLRNDKERWKNITAQTSKSFWKQEHGYRTTGMRPDIVINKDADDCIVLDTKWKNLYGANPSPDDLRQMYVYHQYYNAKRVALVYPGLPQKPVKGNYMSTHDSNQLSDMECAIITLSVEPVIKDWQRKISIELKDWMVCKNK